MKTNWSSILIGAIGIAAIVYFLNRSPSREGFESNPGSIIGMVFAGIMGVGLLIAFVGAMGEGGAYKYN